MSGAPAAKTVAELARGLGLAFDGDGAIAVARPASPDEADAASLALAMDPKYVKKLAASAARAAMVPDGTDWRALGLEAAIFAPRARYAMAGVTAAFADPRTPPPGTHPSAVVDPTAEIAASASVGPFAVIGAGARIGEGAVVGAHVSLGDGARLDEGVRLKNGVRIGHGVAIGARTLVHENAVIGADGFSFVTPEPGAVEIARQGGADPFVERLTGGDDLVWARIASLGAVSIGPDCEIGAAATIDRGTVSDTRIGRGCKIDNQVQIGHNVAIGENCLFCGQSGVAGSARIGDRVVVGGQSGIGDHADVGSDVLVMAASALSGTVKSKSIVGGLPALPREEATRIFMATKRLPRLLEEVAALKKRFS